MSCAMTLATFDIAKTQIDGKVITPELANVPGTIV